MGRKSRCGLIQVTNANIQLVVDREAARAARSTPAVLPGGPQAGQARDRSRGRPPGERPPQFDIGGRNQFGEGEKRDRANGPKRSS